jgi:hypothetical protein
MAAWATITGNIVRAEEWEILRKMDRAYLAAVGTEMAEATKRAEAKRKK